MEARAKPRLRNVEGLWRKSVKGRNGAERRPGAMTDFIRDEQLLPSDEIDAIIAEIPNTTDRDRLVELYTRATEIYLTDVPSFTLMYRPQNFHTVNESVWTNFPSADDGITPPIPPLDLTDGYSIAGLYNLTLVNP